eukprot:CAMPEP_0113941184 /NCGR_PEP_ID=MMETSP1339-20121228/7163_1 /TAXON_ID=94617 /ORGANISM="Fibrocapsa japonica" /LENGTH=143 /DNA_ID=CAMNT_0000945263 /DNA_START=148 /DNA_END=579 /DNA_ORIENTATION=- /assembly_acc=CAM_ASM_000762
MQGASDNNQSCEKPVAGQKRCLPCEGGSNLTVFNEEEARKKVAEAFPKWKLSVNENSSSLSLKREFVAKNFQAALDFVVAAGAIAETEGHHPDLHITSYRNVQVEVYTHSVGGLTENDFILAELLDNVPVEYSPKWLSENPQT